MKGIHRDQVEYLKKRICRGDNSRKLLQKFKKRWELGEVTFHRRVAMARAELRNSGAPAAWVLVNFSHDDSSLNNQNKVPKFCPHGVPLDNQNGGIVHPQKTAETDHQFSTESPIEKVLEKDDQKPEQNIINNVMVQDNQKVAAVANQKRVESTNQKKAEAEVKAVAEELLCTEIMTMDECLLMLTRFAHGQYKRERHIICKGEVVEVQETPTFAARKAAVIAIMKYHQANAAATPKPEYDDPSRYVTMTTNELFNMSKERMRELSLEIHRKREEAQNRR